MMGTTTTQCYIIQVLIFLLLHGNKGVVGFLWVEDKGIVSPTDPKVWAEDTLILQCDVTDMSIPIESKTLHFQWNMTRIPEEFHNRSNNKRYVELALPDVRIEDKGTYYCYLNDTIIASQYVKIFRKPVPVENIDCVVYDWASMRCTWDLGIHYHYPHLINVSVVWTIDHTSAGQYECARLTNTSCTWIENDGLDSFKPDMTYIFVVIVKNIGMEKSEQTQVKRIDTKTVVKPAAVIGITSTSNSSTCLEVTWMNVKPEREKHCVIQLHSKWQKLEKELVTNRRDSAPTHMITVCGLHPYAKYHVNVRCRPRKHGQFFSDRTAREHIMPEDVPSHPPVLYVGSFNEAPYPEDNSLRKVTVYWKPIPEMHQNGRIISYEVTYNGETMVFKDVEISQGSINLRVDLDYEITVRANTKIGPSKYSLPLYVKSKTSKPDQPAWFYAVGNKANDRAPSFRVDLHWDKPASGWDLVTRYTLYYCQGWRFNQTCKGKSSSLNGSLTWLNVSPNATNHTLNLPGTADEYLFGISADTPTFSSGLLWSSCTYYHNKAPVNPPQSFEFSEVKGDLSLTVQWERYKCEESSPVLWYNVHYCLVEGTQNEPICKGHIVTKTAAADQSSYTLYGLEAGRTYAVSLQAMTNGGLGPETPWVYDSAIQIGTSLSSGEIAAASVCGGIVFIFAILGCIVCGRRLHKKIQEPPEDSIIMPPPLPDCYRFESYTEGSHQYALVSSPESPTSRTSLLSNGNSTLASNGSDSTGLTDETAQVFILPKPSGNGFISNGSARSLDKIKLPEKKKGKKQKNPVPEGYIRVSNVSNGSSGSNGSQTLPNNSFSSVVKTDKEAVVMFTVDDGKLKTDPFSPLNGMCKSPVTQYQKNVMNHIEARGDADNGLDSRGTGQSSQSMNHIGSYTRFTDGFSSNCIGSAISLASSGGVLRHSPPPDRCGSTDQELSDYEQPVRGPLSTSTPIPRLSHVKNKCHQSADSELECLDQSYVQYPPLTLDSRSLPSILECAGPSSYTRRNSDGESTLSVCSDSVESLHFSETENDDQKSSFPTLIANSNGYVTQINGTSPSDSLVSNSEPTVVSSTGYVENDFLPHVQVSSSLGYVPNILASDSPDHSSSTNISYSGSDAPSSSSGYIPNNPVNPVSTSLDVISNIFSAPIVTTSGYLTNNCLSVSDPQVSSTEHVSNNPAALLPASCEDSPDRSVSDTGLDNSVPDVVASSGYVPNSVPENTYLSEDQSNTVVLPSSGYLPNNSVPPEVTIDLPKIVEPDVESDVELTIESLEPSGLCVIDGYLRIPDMTVGHSNTDDTLSSTPINSFNSKSDLSKLSCSSVVRPISNYMKDLPVEYFYDPQAMEDLPTTEL